MGTHLKEHEIQWSMRWRVWRLRLRMFVRQVSLDWIEAVTLGGVILISITTFKVQILDLKIIKTYQFITDNFDQIAIVGSFAIPLFLVPWAKLYAERSMHSPSRWSRFQSTLHSNPKVTVEFLIFHIIVYTNRCIRIYNRTLYQSRDPGIIDRIISSIRYVCRSSDEKYIRSGNIGRPQVLAENIYQIWGLRNSAALFDILKFYPTTINKKLLRSIEQKATEADIREQLEQLLKRPEKISNVDITHAALNILSTLGTGNVMNSVFDELRLLGRNHAHKRELLKLIDKGRGTSICKLLDIDPDKEEPDELDQEILKSDRAAKLRTLTTSESASNFVKFMTESYESNDSLKILTTGYSSAVLKALSKLNLNFRQRIQVYVVQASHKPIDEDVEMENSLRTRQVSSLLVSPTQIPSLNIDLCLIGFEMANTSGVIYHPRFSNDALSAILNITLGHDIKDVVAVGESWKVRSPPFEVDYSRVVEFRPEGLTRIITDIGLHPCENGLIDLDIVESKWAKKFNSVSTSD